MKLACFRGKAVNARSRKRAFYYLGLSGVLLFCSVSGKAQGPTPPSNPPKTHPDKNQTCVPPKIYNTMDSGDTVEGPSCVAVSFNALRYVGQLVRAYTVTAGPTLPAGLTPPAAFVASKAASNLLGSSQPQADTLQLIQADYDTAYREYYVTREKANADNAAILNKAVNSLKNLVSASDPLYATRGVPAVMAQVADQKLKNIVSEALNQKWTTSDDIYAVLRGLNLRLQDYSFYNPAPTDAVKAQITLLQTNIPAMQKDVASALASGSQAAAFEAQRSIVAAWATYLYGGDPAEKLAGLSASAFVLKTYVGCGVLFNQNRQIALSLTLTDQLPSFAGTALTSAPAKNPFVTVNCTSPFVVSAGIEFSFLSTNTFGLVPSGSTGANQFGVTNTSNISPLPIAMISGRIYEWSEHKFGVYGSFGTAAHVQGSGTGGSSAEFLAGFSIGLLRTIYITPGWHVGTVSSLNGGYKVGDPVPTGVTAVPVKSAYQSGFGLSITFTKP